MQARARFLLIAPDRTIPLAVGSYVIGRSSEADIPFDRPQLSRRHVRLVVSEDSVDVEDLGSMNGTWVNSYLVQHRLSVKEKSDIKLGDLVLTLTPTSENEIRDPMLGVTISEQKAPDPNSTVQTEAVTQKSSAFEHLRTSLLGFIDAGKLDAAKKALDPVLAEIELSSRPLDEGALEAGAEIALRFALAARDAAYVDAVVRIHHANSAVMAPATVALLRDCVAAGLEPDPRNTEEYLQSVRSSPSTRAPEISRLEQALTSPSATLPAPAPGPDTKY